MSISYEKANAIDEVTPIIDLLREVHSKLSRVPRSLTASRQLRVIITKLEGWHQTHSSTAADGEDYVPSVDQVIKEAVQFIESKYKG